MPDSGINHGKEHFCRALGEFVFVHVIEEKELSVRGFFRDIHG